jgi:hypothetical protein
MSFLEQQVTSVFMPPHTVDTEHPKLAATGEENNRGLRFVEAVAYVSVLGEYPGVLFGFVMGFSSRLRELLLGSYRKKSL